MFALKVSENIIKPFIFILYTFLFCKFNSNYCFTFLCMFTYNQSSKILYDIFLITISDIMLKFTTKT